MVVMCHGDTVKLPGRPARSMVPLLRRKMQQHHGESRGYGNNPLNRDNGQPSPKGATPGLLWMQFTD
jgi:hypothetical protein